jgi:hypothetical protein
MAEKPNGFFPDFEKFFQDSRPCDGDAERLGHWKKTGNRKCHAIDVRAAIVQFLETTEHTKHTEEDKNKYDLLNPLSVCSVYSVV